MNSIAKINKINFSSRFTVEKLMSKEQKGNKESKKPKKDPSEKKEKKDPKRYD